MNKTFYAIKEEDKIALMKDLLNDSGKIMITNSFHNSTMTAPNKKNKNYTILGWNFPVESFENLFDAMNNYAFLCIAIEKPKKEESK